jgi:hypothetical protein
MEVADMADYSGYRCVTLHARTFFAPCFDPLILCIKHSDCAVWHGARKPFRISWRAFATHTPASFCTPVPQGYPQKHRPEKTISVSSVFTLFAGAGARSFL